MSTATMPNSWAANRAASKCVSEQLAEGLRNEDRDSLENCTAHSAALVKLLASLGGRVRPSEIIEALPHFSDHFDLVDLRNVMVELGYHSDPFELKAQDLDGTLLPCLLETPSNQVLVVTRRNGPEFEFYNATTKQHAKGELPGMRGRRGTAYLFTDTHVTHAVDNQTSESWFSSVLGRFKPLVWHLLCMTLLLNIIALLVPLFIMVVYDKVIGTYSLSSLPYLLSGLGFALLCELGLRLLRARTLGLVAGRLDYLIATATFGQLLRLPPALTERSTVSAQLQKLRQFDAIRDFFTGPNAVVALELPFVGIFILVMAVISGPLALVPIGLIIAYVALGAFALPAIQSRLAAASRAKTARQQLLIETFSGLREFKALGAEDTWRERFRESTGAAMQSGAKVAIHLATVQCIAQALMNIAGILMIVLGAFAVMNQSITIGALVALMALLWRVLGPLQNAFLAYLKAGQVVQGIAQINQLMRLKKEQVHKESTLLYPPVDGRVNYDRVSFRYAPDRDPATLGVSFEVEPGEFIAITGPNGAGKSTLLKLLAGMYRPQAGTLSIGGSDVRQFNPVELRRMIAYVPQNPTLFHGTIAQNLRLADPMADDARLDAALEQAGILEDVKTLPQGLETRIGDSATQTLPSSFVHRLCLARAYVKQAPILLLDEPGNTLDRAADNDLVEQLRNRKGKQTVVMVSHRPSHIRLADKVIIIEGGMARFVGSPEEAMKKLIAILA